MRARVERVIDEVVGPYVRDDLAKIERVRWEDCPGPEICVTPAREGAAGLSVGPGPLSPWFSMSVGLCTLELYTGEEDWEETLATYLRSAVEGRYLEAGGRGRLGPYVKMIFERPDGEPLIYTVGGLYEGAEKDFPPGERRYPAYG